MSEDIGNLNVRISADTSDLTKGLSNARKGMDSFRQSITPVIKTVGAVAAASTAAAAGIVAFTKAASDNARELQSMAKLANTSTQELQRMAFGARSVGIEQGKLADILKDVNDRVGDFLTTGGGEMADFFEKIAPQVGVTAEQFRNLSGPQSLQLFASSLEKANVSQAEMVFYMESMADEATGLLPLLRNNGAEFGRMAAEAEALGIVLSDIEVASLRDFGNEFNRMSGIVRGVSNLVAVELAPVLAEIGDRITDAAVEMGGMDVAIRTTVENGIRLISGFADRIQEFRIQLAGMDRAWYEAQYAVADFVESSWRTLSPFFDNIVSQVNTVISAFELIPGVGDLGRVESFSGGDFFQGIMDQTDLARENVQAARREFVRLSEQDMPSTKIEEFFESVDARREELKEKIAKDGGFIPGMGGGSGEDGEASEKRQKELEKQREQMEQRLEILRESLMNERELETENYLKKAEQLALFRENELIGEEEHKAMLRELAQQHEDKMTEIEKRGADERAKVEKRHADVVVGMRKNVVQQSVALLDMFAGESKAAALASIALQKGLAIAETVMNTQVAQMRALAELGPIAGPPVAAKIGALGAVSTGIIAAQGLAQAASAMGGGGASSLGSGGGGGATGGGSANQPASQAPPATAGGTLTVQGISDEGRFSGSQMRELAEELLEYQKRGGVIVIE